MRTPPSLSVIEYALLVLFVVLAVSAAFTYVWPIADVFAHVDKIIGTALAATK